MDQNNIKSIFEDAFKNKTKVITEEKAKDILIHMILKYLVLPWSKRLKML